MIHRLAGLVAVVLGVLVLAAPAGAITNGVPDGNGHPNVGGLVAAQAYSDGTWIYCSGTLIAPRVFLTAAHCGEGDRVRVTFASAYKDGDKVYAGTWHADPAYSSSQSDPHDMAVVVFDKAVTGITPAALPTAGSLAGLPGSQQFTSVGYGSIGSTTGGGTGKTFVYTDTRNVAVGTLNTETGTWLKISQNASHDDGGTCFGDSGGPNFLGSSNVIAATTITGDNACHSTNVDYRLDTPSARGFLGQYVTLP